MHISSPFVCDPVTGICSIPEERLKTGDQVHNPGMKPVQVIYFTDPICSTCWGVEPQLRKFKLEYGHYFDIEYRMGGLLKSWETYGGKDVAGPAEVAAHWEEVGAKYKMPVNGKVWREDPLASSFPPSIAFKAAQLQDPVKAIVMLRCLREMVFVKGKNITRDEHIATAAVTSGLNSDKLLADMKGPARSLFEDDLRLAADFHVRGFPTFFMTDDDSNRLKVYGYKPYAQFESALLSLYPDAVPKKITSDPLRIFDPYPTLTTMEYAVINDLDYETAEKQLQTYCTDGRVYVRDFPGGPLWFRIE